MKKLFAFILLAFISLGLYQYLYTHNQSNMPAPTDTIVRWDMEDGGKGSARDRYIEAVHGGPDVDWRTIEHENSFQQARLKQKLRSQGVSRNGEEWVGEGTAKGRWLERGSNNQAGNIVKTHYNSANDQLFAIGGGGPMFVSDISGFGWELVNDDFRFSSGLLETVELDGELRIIAAIGNVPYYSDDNGATWEKSFGISASSGGSQLFDSYKLADGEIILITKSGWNSNHVIYGTEDNGETYEFRKIITTQNSDDIAMAQDDITGEVYLMEQVNLDQSALHRYNIESNEFELITDISPMGFGQNGRGNLQAVTYNDTLSLYAYDGEDRFHQSKDLGESWVVLSTLPTTPWAVGVYVTPSNPSQMIYGEVNPYTSNNGGKNWIKLSNWWEYYSNVRTKLHADIMEIREYKYSDGSPFTLISNHGGISITEDYGRNTENIGMFNLNVSQYYDVATSPNNPSRIVAGAQDQGLQKGFITGDHAVDFVQNISGDYGHSKFTGDGESLWTVYPGGSISFYERYFSQSSPTHGYEIDSRNETVWIPPIIAGPNEGENVVYAAGGSVNPDSYGSHIIVLSADENGITAMELPFDFSGGGQISAMAFSPFDKDIMYVATTEGVFYKSIDGGQSFDLKDRQLAGDHYLYGSHILPSKKDPNVVYLSGNGYSGSPIWRSTDGGESFEPFSTGMPRTVAFKLAMDENEELMFASCEAGPFILDLNEEVWYDMSGVATPNQTYWSVEYIDEINTARFATYGRGVWDFEVVSRDPTDVADTEDVEVQIYPNPSSDQVRVNVDKAINQIEIFNSVGQRVLSLTGNKQNSQYINVHDLQSGQYYVHIKSFGNIYTSNFVKI